MLTTTVDGLWVLQAVTGVEQTCPELGLRPLLPRLDTAERALRHPVAAELMAVGALDQAGNADPMVREWLTVLLRRDLGLLVTIGVPGGEPTRAAICRFATWWVVLERHGNLVRLYPAGTASDEAGAGELVVGQVERLCGVAEAAPLRPVTVDADELLHAVRDAGTLRSYLLSQRLDVDQLQMVTMAADPTRSAHATLVALQAGVGPEKSARILVGDSTVAIVDTAAGRICVESVTSGQRRYQVLSPGSRSDIGGAVQRLIRRLPLSTTPMSRATQTFANTWGKTRSGSTYWPEIGHQTSPGRSSRRCSPQCCLGCGELIPSLSSTPRPT